MDRAVSSGTGRQQRAAGRAESDDATSKRRTGSWAIRSVPATAMGGARGWGSGRQDRAYGRHGGDGYVYPSTGGPSEAAVMVAAPLPRARAASLAEVEHARGARGAGNKVWQVVRRGNKVFLRLGLINAAGVFLGLAAARAAEAAPEGSIGGRHREVSIVHHRGEKGPGRRTPPWVPGQGPGTDTAHFATYNRSMQAIGAARGIRRQWAVLSFFAGDGCPKASSWQQRPRAPPPPSPSPSPHQPPSLPPSLDSGPSRPLADAKPPLPRSLSARSAARASRVAMAQSPSANSAPSSAPTASTASPASSSTPATSSSSSSSAASRTSPSPSPIRRPLPRTARPPSPPATTPSWPPPPPPPTSPSCPRATPAPPCTCCAGRASASSSRAPTTPRPCSS